MLPTPHLQTTQPDSDTVITTKCSKQAPFDDTIYHHKRVFVVAEVDDTYVYHTHLEIMPRIVYHLDFLKQNPDIKIMVSTAHYVSFVNYVIFVLTFLCL